MIELPLIVEMDVETDAEYEMEVDTTFTQGGGATNFVEGSFTVGTDTTQIIEIPYTGNGYPIACAIWIDGGIFAPNDDNFRTAPIYSIAQFNIFKTYADDAPDYQNNTSNNRSMTLTAYKYLQSSLSIDTDNVNRLALTYSTESPESSTSICARFNSNKILNIFTGQGNANYHFAQGFTYRYFVVYSE